MTPARLEEAAKDLNRDTCGENDDHCAGCGQGMEAAHELLAEVKRLRTALEEIRRIEFESDRLVSASLRIAVMALEPTP